MFVCVSSVCLFGVCLCVVCVYMCFVSLVVGGGCRCVELCVFKFVVWFCL